MEIRDRATHMYYNDIVIKGSRTGLRVILPLGMDFPRIKQQITERFNQAGGFFKGAKIIVEHTGKQFSRLEEEELVQLLYGFDIQMVEFKYHNRDEEKTAKEEAAPVENKPDFSGEPAVVIKKTVRSGQKIVSPGHLIVYGDVNPGGEIIAQGDILVFGSLRGIAHAGKSGDHTASVAALVFQPTQIRIADKIVRPPERKRSASNPEAARIKDGQIIVEELDFRNFGSKIGKVRKLKQI